MPGQLTSYRILIEFPEGFDGERRAFGELVDDYNTTDAIPHGVLFIPIGWEPGLGENERLTYEDLRLIDYFIVVLHDRWPDGVQQDYDLARMYVGDPDVSMRQVVPFFRAVSVRRLEDPGPRLQEVLLFRERLESERKVRFESFDSTEAFAHRVRRHLTRWLVEHDDRGMGPSDEPGPHPIEPPVEPAAEPPVGPEGDGPDVGPVTPPSFDDADDLNRHGLLLQREGMLEEAEQLHSRALDLCRDGGPSTTLAIAHGNLGVIHRWQREFPKAEESLRSAIEICEQLRSPIGMAAGYSALGLTYQHQGELEKAEKAFESALRNEMELDRPDGLSTAYKQLAVVVGKLGRPEEAERLQKLSRAVSAEPEYPGGELFPTRI